MKKLIPLTCLLVAGGSIAAAQDLPTVSPVQSTANPLNLPLWGPVYEGASDGRSQDFFTNVMPTFIDVMENHLAEGVVFGVANGFKLDPSRLILRTEADKPIRVYFINDGAGYHNTVGIAWTEVGAESMGTPQVIFPDSSIAGGWNPQPNSTRTTWEPLRRGDFVELGVGARGMKLDFFLISNAVNGGTHWLWNDPEANVDGLNHMVAFMLQDSRYIMIGFEDIIGGGDLDYNDAVFVVDIGEVNAENLWDQDSDLPH